MTVRAAILSVGSELLRGDIVDTNAAFLARQLSQLGFQVWQVTQVGDCLAELTAAVADALERSEVVISTGGLGPTQDDLTRQAIAAAVGEEPFEDPILAGQIEARFAAMGRAMPASNRQQALLIPSGRALPNPNGTAPGWEVEREGRIIFALPGPPLEMQPMWEAEVRPGLERLLPGATAMRSLMTFGLGESLVEQMIEPLLHRWSAVTIATYAKTGGVQVHITARAAGQSEAKALAAEAERAVAGRLGPAIFGRGDQTLAQVVGELLRQRQLTLAVMESASGGELANLITAVPGSSQYFQGGVVAYTETAKVAQGVDPAVLATHGLISPQTALAMARAARERFATPLGVGITGIAGDSPMEGQPPGTVWLAAAFHGQEEIQEIHRPGRRDVVKRHAAQSALDLVRRMLERNG